MPDVPLHWMLLNDRRRLRLYERAIAARVRPGDVVVDLGAGTGILGFFALRAGARRVYAVEKRPILHLARALARATGFADRIRFLAGRSDRVRPPERADLLVTEILGSLAFDEEIVRYVRDARARFLTPRGRVIPSRVDLIACPVHAPAFHRSLGARVAGFDFGPFHDLARNSALHRPRPTGRALATPAAVIAIEFEGRRFAPVDDEHLAGRARLRIRRPGVLHALRLWFDAVLAPGIVLSSSHGTHWANPYLPVSPPIPVRPGDDLRLHMTLSRAENISWDYTLSRRGTRVAAGAHSTHLADERLFAPRRGVRR